MRRVFLILVVALFVGPMAGPAAVTALVRDADGCCAASCPEEDCPADAGDCLPLCVDCSCSRSERALPCGPDESVAPCIVPLPPGAPESDLPWSDPREVLHVPEPTA
jgi:hypothetical protein